MTKLLALFSLLISTGTFAQSVQPVIVEYRGYADGKIMLTNNTDRPFVVVLEPKSFSITPDGRGVFRHLDPGINVELSRTSVRLEPKQSYYVFYKASSETLPAWFTIYSSFSKAEHGPGMDVRILLPHTVYLYQREPIARGDVRITDAVFSAQTKKLICDLENDGNALARVQEVLASGEHASESAAGFPLLPAGRRRIEVDWPDKTPPTEISFRFEHFTLRQPVTVGDH